MFCRKCGAEITDTAKFCPKCGTKVYAKRNGEKKQTEDNELRFDLKPEFTVSYKLLNAIWTGILWCIIIGYYANDFGIDLAFPILLIIFYIYIVFNLIFGKMQYENMQYNFYDKRVEYIDGFFNKEKKELKYKHIREVTMSQNILERFCGIGKIKIFTNASSGYNAYYNHNGVKGKNGICIHCVVDVEEEYKKIKQIIDEGISEE